MMLVQLSPTILIPPRYELIPDVCNLSPNSSYRTMKSAATTTITTIRLDGQVYQCRDGSVRDSYKKCGKPVYTYVVSKIVYVFQLVCTL